MIFKTPDKPPLDEDQLELLENGFPVEPSYDPRFYPDSRIDPKHVDEVIESFRERDYGKELYAPPETQDNAIT